MLALRACIAIKPGAVLLGDTNFTDGTIELEVAGKPRSTAANFARGFIGVAFRVQQDQPSNYEAFYLRPTNGRSEDQFVLSYKIDASTNPAKVDLEITESPFGAGVKAERIVRFENGNLTMCYPPMGGAAPKQFKADEGSGFHMFKLKKK